MVSKPVVCSNCQRKLHESPEGLYCTNNNCMKVCEVVYKGGLGVIVARFQVPYLHEGHSYLISQALQQHDSVVVFLGTPKAFVPSIREPLDYATRYLMIRRAFPQVHIRRQVDIPADDKLWSSTLDSEIDDFHFAPEKVTLYGGRDSFLKHYSGKYKSIEINTIASRPGKEIRAEITEPENSEDFRRGVIYVVNQIFGGKE